MNDRARVNLVAFLLVAALVVLVTAPAQAAEPEPWPAEPWRDARKLTHLDPDMGNNLSGAHWNPVTRTLWVCINGPARFWALREGDDGRFEIATDDEGRQAVYRVHGDTEGITQVDLASDVVYLVDEGDHTIRAYDTAQPGTAERVASWDLTDHVPAGYGHNKGLEGLTFVPDEVLVRAGFVDSSGAPYVSRGGLGGLMIVAHQGSGHLLVVDLAEGGGESDLVAEMVTSRDESSGLELDPETGQLYIWHNIDGNTLEVVELASEPDEATGLRRFVTVREFDGPSGGNIEGIALTPDEARWIFMTDDANLNGRALMWFREVDANALAGDDS